MAQPDPWAKLHRAAEHLAVLAPEIHDFLDDKHGPTHSFDEEHWLDEEGDEWYVIACGSILRPLPTRWALIAGDAIHNMRSALDHLTCGLVRANGNEPTRRTQFPIYDHEPNGNQRRGINGNLAGMHDDDAARIRQMQPYLQPEMDRSDLLLRLGRLDNDDKHQLVNPVYAISDSAHVFIEPEDVSPREHLHFLQAAAVTPGTPLLRWRVDSPIERVVPTFRFTVGFGFEATSSLKLRSIHSAVTEIAQSFERFRQPP